MRWRIHLQNPSLKFKNSESCWTIHTCGTLSFHCCYLIHKVSFQCSQGLGAFRLFHTHFSLPAPITVPVTQEILNKGLLNKFTLFTVYKKPSSLCSQISRAQFYIFTFSNQLKLFSVKCTALHIVGPWF